MEAEDSLVELEEEEGEKKEHPIRGNKSGKRNNRQIFFMATFYHGKRVRYPFAKKKTPPQGR